MVLVFPELPEHKGNIKSMTCVSIGDPEIFLLWSLERRGRADAIYAGKTIDRLRYAVVEHR
jgi:hypothetical protein